MFFWDHDYWKKIVTGSSFFHSFVGYCMIGHISVICILNTGFCFHSQFLGLQKIITFVWCTTIFMESLGY